MTPFEEGYYGTMKLAGLMGRAVDKTVDSFRALGELPSQFKNWGEGRRMATQQAGLAAPSREQAMNALTDAAGRKPGMGKQMNQISAESSARKARDFQETADFARSSANRQMLDAGKAALPSAGLVAVPGVAGATYLGGDADTMPNKLKNMSNDNFGTNFSTQSRLGAMLG